MRSVKMEFGLEVGAGPFVLDSESENRHCEVLH